MFQVCGVVVEGVKRKRRPASINLFAMYVCVMLYSAGRDTPTSMHVCGGILRVDGEYTRKITVNTLSAP